MAQRKNDECMKPLYDGTVSLPDYGGYFGYRVYKNYVEYVDVDSWTGGSKPEVWSYQAFYDKYNNQKDALMEQGVIEFLLTNKLVDSKKKI